MDFQEIHFIDDATNPEAREYVWEKAKKNYYDKGVKYSGWMKQNRNIQFMISRIIVIISDRLFRLKYLSCYVCKAFLMNESRRTVDIINLLRCAWAGSEIGALVWSGDINLPSEYEKSGCKCAGLIWELQVFRGGQQISADFRSKYNDPEFHELGPLV